MRGAQRYALAAEIRAVALAGDLANSIIELGDMVTLEVDNASVPGVVEGSYRLPGSNPNLTLSRVNAKWRRYCLMKM